MLTKEFFAPSPAWRWHGLGMLQREISESTRVHVWHPALVKVPMGFRRVHDHRFDLTSLVLVGELVDKAYAVVLVDEATDANTHAWSIVHAKIQRGTGEKPSTHPTGPGDDPDVEYIGKVFAKCTGDRIRLPGEVYRVARGDFHESDPRTLAITIVSRENFDRLRQARVLGDTAHSAIAGQHHTIERDDSIVGHILGIAAQALVLADEGARRFDRRR